MELFGKFVYDIKNGVYKFNVNRVITWRTEYGILRIVGDHMEGKNNEDVRGIEFKNFKLEYFPKNIEQFFPNLKILTINRCLLTTISKHDLTGLKQLRQLNMNGNFIRSLPNNLFENVSEIETVSFNRNRIEFIGPNIFDGLRNLSCVNLKMNPSIDACFKKNGELSLDQLKTIIEENCQPKVIEEFDEFFDCDDIQLFMDSFEIFEYSFAFRDFDISC